MKNSSPVTAELNRRSNREWVRTIILCILPYVHRERNPSGMRINVYSQELTKEIELVSKVAETGIRHYGVRLYLASPDILHHTPTDDDRSAITFWIPNAQSFTKGDLAALFHEMEGLADDAPDP